MKCKVFGKQGPDIQYRYLPFKRLLENSPKKARMLIG